MKRFLLMAIVISLSVKWFKLAAEQRFEAAQFKLEIMHPNPSLLN